MKVTAIRATPVNLPLDAPYVWAEGTLPGFSKTIVEVDTDEGLTGLGETASWASARLITDSLADVLVGHDPMDIARAELRCLPTWRGVQSTADYALIRAFGGIEMALWDIRGKAWDVPLHQLLGGAVRTEVPFTEYFAFRTRRNGKGGESTPEEVADYCVEARESRGATLFEGKLSHPDFRVDLRMLELIRDRLGDDVTIRVDSNAAHTLTTARQMAPALEDIGVRYWEDPVGTPEEMTKLRQHTSIPFSSHNLDLRRAVDLGVPDAIVSDVSNHGGLGRTQRFIAACEAMGIDYWCYSGDSGVATAAYLHICATNSWVTEPNQSLLGMQSIDVIEGGPFETRDDVVPVPDGPGLGVDLSRDALAHCHDLFASEGPYNKYHDPDHPGRYRRLPYV